MMQNNQKGASIFLLLVVLALVFFGIRSVKNNPSSGGGVTFGGDVSNGANNQGGANTRPVITNYEQALLLFQERRIQLDENCQARPNNVTFKNGTLVMIDNRSDKLRTVRLGAVFSIKPYSYQVVKMDNPKNGSTIYMGCDGSQNVATILIQK
jgi:hypothetical protein